MADIRHAFNTEVPITQMAAIGTETGLTLRAHNLLAKTRACAARWYLCIQTHKT